MKIIIIHFLVCPHIDVDTVSDSGATGMPKGDRVNNMFYIKWL
jgi:hypothetical protein